MSIGSIGTRTSFKERAMARTSDERKFAGHGKSIVMTIDEIQRIKLSCQLNND